MYPHSMFLRQRPTQNDIRIFGSYDVAPPDLLCGYLSCLYFVPHRNAAHAKLARKLRYAHIPLNLHGCSPVQTAETVNYAIQVNFG